MSADAARAVALWRAAADRGAATAQHNLGIAYALGRGVERDEARAIRWLGTAGRNGLSLAENTLGVLYLRAGDERSGAVWLSRAVARGGYGAAVRNLARLHETKAEDPGYGEWFRHEDGPEAELPVAPDAASFEAVCRDPVSGRDLAVVRTVAGPSQSTVQIWRVDLESPAPALLYTETREDMDSGDHDERGLDRLIAKDGTCLGARGRRQARRREGPTAGPTSARERCGPG